MNTDYELKNNRINKQFEFQIDGLVAKLEYIRANDRIFLTHTEVPDQLGGRGIGSKLVKAVLQEIERQDLTLIPLCPFVAGYIKEHPKWRKLVMKGINIA
jgi:predicted GNAT family acetyltransferase